MTDTTVDEVVVPSNIVINGTEYSPEDAQRYIETGKRTMDLEKQWNTPVDKVWPEYGKTRETLKQVESEREQLKQQLADFQAKQDRNTETPADVAAIRESAKKFGIVLDEDAKSFIKRDDLESYLSERDQKRDAEKRTIDGILAEAEKLKAELNGTDGRPKFIKEAVLGFAAATNESDLRKAYETMYKEDLDAWKQAQIDSAKKAPLKTLKPTVGIKSPTEVKPNNDNLEALLHDALHGTE